MTVIIKVNLVQIIPFQNSQRVRVRKGYKKAYVGVTEMRLGKRVRKRLKCTKLKRTYKTKMRNVLN